MILIVVFTMHKIFRFPHYLIQSLNVTNMIFEIIINLAKFKEFEKIREI